MPMITLDQRTFDAINLAARIMGMRPPEVVAQLVEHGRLSTSPASVPVAEAGKDSAATIYADYEGHRTTAQFDRLTKRIDITDGPLAGQSFKSPSSAARAVVGHYKPDVNPHRNGWSFWILDDGSGRFLQSIRES